MRHGPAPMRYSVENVARHAQRDTLRKAWSAANTLFEYYNSIARLMWLRRHQ